MNLQGAESGRMRMVSEPIQVTVMPSISEDGEAKTVQARMRIIPPKVRTVCQAMARWYLEQLVGQAAQPQEIEDVLRQLLVSWCVVHDDGVWRSPVYPFPALFDKAGRVLDPGEERMAALHASAVFERCPNPSELWADYRTFAETEFPPYPTEAQLTELMEDAKKKSLETLLSQHGFWHLQRLLTGLVRRVGGRLARGTSTDGSV